MLGMRFGWASAVPLLLVCAQRCMAYSLINCYAELPSGFTKDNTNEYQSSGLCSASCTARGAQYFALSNHQDCYCGGVSPVAAGVATANTCDAYCFGYRQEMCGGETSFSVYTMGDVAVTPSASADALALSTSPTSSARASALALSTSPTSTSTASSASTPSTTQQTTPSSSFVVSASASTPPTTIVYSTALHTEGGSTVIITNTVTTSTLATPTGDSSDTTDAPQRKSHKANVGAIVGGVVGGVCGAIAVGVAVLLGLRHYNMKREEEKMELEYQEAIKPVEYTPIDIPSSSSHSLSFEHTDPKNAHPPVPPPAAARDANPFDDSRRLSTGSVFPGDTPDAAPNKLTIVNPDEDR
ncbi:Slg1p KNAG_0L00910 [Huiozyma naganishii CBS 8797]|uniref:WSC domain-containing protein n=1 Tax=Huiozyma naganishii (strain ATCC MYA-139 / BCRC 22969 / CBS 8797 / KCTC 17520 / NBRC 10181 / NCYC 3082 / Yp74L-3) TaxID=1071383 RepID=J7S3M5_HUIN7|nr:hypothetical protein KNAG_0L00910 [Kazachstania naganishii CBS 8797]CCK72712.1 hypothetical protein KNAG_0L00910 [Kazachstania naganishii CBS 8797]